MGKPINKSETDQRDVMTILREENPVGYAAMMKRETTLPRVDPSAWKREILGQPMPAEHHHSERDMLEITKRISRIGIDLTPRTKAAPSFPPIAPNPFLSMIKKEKREPYTIEPFRWELPTDAKVERVQIGNAKIDVVADPTLPKHVSYVLGVAYGVASSAVAVFSTDDRGEIHYVSPDGEKTKITSGEAVRSAIHNDEVCGEPYCWCNRTHTDE